jgi:hypothetical protein
MKPIFLPKNFDGRKHLENWSTKITADGDINPDVLEYIVHMILRKYSFSDKYEEKRKGFVPIYSVTLKRISQHYRQHLEYLRDTNVIDINDAYSTTRKFTKAYRFRQEYKFAKPIAKQLTNRRLLRLHNAINQEEIERMQRVKAKYPYLVDSLDNLQIDREAALAYVDRLSGACIFIYGPDVFDKLRWRFNLMRLGIERIAHQDISYQVDEKGRRFHSNLVSLKKELRHFLTYGGEPLGDIDIKNSQPYLSQVLLQPEFWAGRIIDERPPSTKSRHRQLLREGKESPETLYMLSEGKLGWNDILQETTSDTYDQEEMTEAATQIDKTLRERINMFLKNSEMPDSKGFALFHYMVNTGLYEFLMDQIPELIFYDAEFRNLYIQIKSPKITRPFVKKLTMIALYSPPNSTVQRSKFARRMLQLCFPGIMEVLAAIKAGKGESYKRLPIMLQRIESMLVLDKISKEFSKRYRQPVFTIHDGLVTTLPYLSKLKAVAEEIITRAVGVVPNLVEEQWSPEHLENKMDVILEQMMEKQHFTPEQNSASEPLPEECFNSGEYYCILVP